MAAPGSAGSEPEAEPLPAEPPAAPDPPEPPVPAPPPDPVRATRVTLDPATRWRRAALGALGGFAVVALGNAVAIAATLSMPPGGIGLRLAQHAFDAAEMLGIGLLAALVIGGWVRLVRVPLWISVLVYALASAAIMHGIVGRDLLRQAMIALEGRLETPIYVALVLACGAGIPLAHLLGSLFTRYRRLWVLPLLVAIGGMITNHAVVRDDYPGLHSAIGWGAATMAGAALAPHVERLATTWAGRRTARPVAVALLALILLGIAIPPSSGVRLELFREPGSMGAWALALLYWSPPPLDRTAAPPTSPWFGDRSSFPPVPPSSERLVEKNPVVVMITIDALRADVIEDPKNDKVLPTFRELKRRGVYFTGATSPGSQTAVSLTATFSGRYFSQLEWSMHGVGSTRFAYAADDATPRFPQLLTEAGVKTASFCSLNFLAGDFGVIRGFAEERMIAQGRRHAMAKDMIDPLLDRLKRAGDEPTFLFVHLMEPHAPYDRGTLKEGPDKDRYVSEVAVADAQLARVVKLLQQRFADRAVLIVGADHGEAFGEHGTFQHTKTLYQELLRIPLLVQGPGIAARRISQHVGLIDIGPTILDLFGLPTPGAFMGQTLVPLLAGGDKELDRPVFAEGRLREALYYGGVKVIEDSRRKTVEVYDLERDPGELDNLFDREPARSQPALAALRAFFAANALANKRPGYTPPYKP